MNAKQLLNRANQLLNPSAEAKQDRQPSSKKTYESPKAKDTFKA